MTQTWTPGPWIDVPQTDGSAMICHEYETGKQLNPKGLRLIANVLARRNSLAEDEANARLIAAAPELYAALKDLLKASQTDEPDDWLAGWQAANAAIAKVRG